MEDMKFVYQAVINHPISAENARKCLEKFGELVALGVPPEDLITEMEQAYIRRLQYSRGYR